MIYLLVELVIGIIVGAWFIRKALIENMIIASAFKDGYFEYKEIKYKLVKLYDQKSYDSLRKINVV